MALVATVTKMWPVLEGNGLTLTMEVVLTDDLVEVRRKQFPEKTEKSVDINALATRFSTAIQPWIDAYKAEKAIYVHSRMATLVTAIQENLTV